MCVIVGFTQKTRGREEVLACLDRAYTRGPDMARVAETASGWLGFRRLSIMGLDERGMQPFALGPDQVVCNGELYGWRRQRAELEQRGYTFRSGSDCELLLPMYREYGLDMFARLDAEFALILYDGEADEYVAARDPIGIRPLFYGCFFSRSGESPPGFLKPLALFSTRGLAIITWWPQPKHSSRKSAPTRRIFHSRLPQGWGFFSFTISPTSNFSRSPIFPPVYR